MSLQEGCPEPFVGDMGVALGSRHGCVSQQFLNAAQVRSPGQQMSGHGVPQCVRSNGYPTCRGGGVDHAASNPGVEATASGTEEHPGRTARSRHTVPDRQPRVEGTPSRGTHGDCALLVTLTQHTHRRVLEINITQSQPAGLRDTQPAGVEQLDQGHVAQRYRITFGGCRGQGRDGIAHLGFGRHLRQDTWPSWGTKPDRWVRCDETLSARPSEETSGAGDTALQGRRFGPGIDLFGQPGT